LTRRAQAGVSLIEMLVVLALFAMVASAVLLTLPSGRQSKLEANQIASLTAHLKRATTIAMARDQAFALVFDGDHLRFVEADGTGWTDHSEKSLAGVKLSVDEGRMSLNRGEYYAVSRGLVPLSAAPLRIEFETQAVVFDGVNVRLEGVQR
jgi:type II secretion system protein H